MGRDFMPTRITVAQLTNVELKNEALSQRGNVTLEAYRMHLDRTLQYASKCEEVLYVGDERRALVSWEGGRSCMPRSSQQGKRLSKRCATGRAEVGYVIWQCSRYDRRCQCDYSVCSSRQSPAQ